MIWAGYVACEGMMIHAHETLIGKFDGKGPLGKRNRKWEDHHRHLPPWIRSLELFRHRRVAIVSWGVHDLFFLEVCS